jgi:hypothetical protein
MSLPRPAEMLLGILCCFLEYYYHAFLSLLFGPELLFLLLLSSEEETDHAPWDATNHIAFLPLRTLTHAASHTLRLLGWCFKLPASFTNK